MEMQDSDAITLEAMIDSFGLAKVINTLADICFGKAEHLRSNWQDETTARLWDKAGYCINSTLSEPTHQAGLAINLVS